MGMPGCGFIFADQSQIVHADFLNGWDVPKLQEVVNECNYGADGGTQCAKDKLTTNPNSGKCTIDGKTLVDEEVVNVKTLPGQGEVGLINVANPLSIEEVVKGKTLAGQGEIGLTIVATPPVIEELVN